MTEMFNNLFFLNYPSVKPLNSPSTTGGGELCARVVTEITRAFCHA